MMHEKSTLKKILFVSVLIAVLATGCGADPDAKLYPIKVPDEDEPIGDKYGYIDAEGEVVIKPQFEHAGTFREGKGYVRNDGERYYVNSKGRKAVDPDLEEYSNMFTQDQYFPFSDGYAAVYVGNVLLYIDDSGNVVLETDYYSDNTELDFNEGLARYGTRDTIDDHLQTGYFNKDGDIVIEAQFGEAGPFIEGLAFVTKDGNPYYINKDGETVIELREDERGEPFENGVAFIYGPSEMGDPPTYRFIDTEGQQLTDDEAVEKLGYVPTIYWEGVREHYTLDGELLNDELDFARQSAFDGELAEVVYYDEEERQHLGYMNRDGEIVWSVVSRASRDD